MIHYKFSDLIAFFESKTLLLGSRTMAISCGDKKKTYFCTPFINGRDPKLKHNGKNQIGSQRPQKTRFV